MGPTIDAHHHFWQHERMPPVWHQPARAAIARDYEPDDLAGPARAAGVDGTVLMQAAETTEENTRLLAYADDVPLVAGVVGWLPLAEPDRALAELDRIGGHPGVRGIRCLIDRDDADWLVSDGTLGVLRELANRGLTWDVVAVTTRQVEHVREIATALPNLRIVVDHLARPPIEDGGWEPWASHVDTLARLPNVALKISIGIDLLDAWPQWDASALDRYVAWVVERFGPDRLLLASNWPVVELLRPYEQAWADQVAALRRAGLSDDQLAGPLGQTARTWYTLTLS